MARGWTSIGEEQWNEFRRNLADISPETIRKSGLKIEAPWCGVNQHTLEDLAASLIEFAGIYEAKPNLQDLCRKQVIEAKDRARWQANRHTTDESTRKRKEEMVEWMLIWLSNPTIFSAWHAIRTHRNESN